MMVVTLQLHALLFALTFIKFCMATTTYQGFIGPYHPSNSTLPDGSGRGITKPQRHRDTLHPILSATPPLPQILFNAHSGIWPTFRFGQVAIENSASDGDGWLLSNDLEYHCQEKDVNNVMAILLPPTEGRVA